MDAVRRTDSGITLCSTVSGTTLCSLTFLNTSPAIPELRQVDFPPFSELETFDRWLLLHITNRYRKERIKFVSNLKIDFEFSRSYPRKP